MWGEAEASAVEEANRVVNEPRGITPIAEGTNRLSGGRRHKPPIRRARTKEAREKRSVFRGSAGDFADMQSAGMGLTGLEDVPQIPKNSTDSGTGGAQSGAIGSPTRNCVTEQSETTPVSQATVTSEHTTWEQLQSQYLLSESLSGDNRLRQQNRAELLQVIVSWPALPRYIRQAIMTLVQSMNSQGHIDTPRETNR